MDEFDIGSNFKKISYVLLFISIISLIGQILKPETGAIVYSIFFGVTSVFLYPLSKSKLTITQETLELLLHFGRKEKVYSINWAEVQKIYTDGKAYQFTGNQKCLTLSLFAVSKSKKEKIERLIHDHIFRHNIELLLVDNRTIITKQVNVEKK
jgi:hypothetical protein